MVYDNCSLNVGGVVYPRGITSFFEEISPKLNCLKLNENLVMRYMNTVENPDNFIGYVVDSKDFWGDKNKINRVEPYLKNFFVSEDQRTSLILIENSAGDVDFKGLENIIAPKMKFLIDIKKWKPVFVDLKAGNESIVESGDSDFSKLAKY